jgi:para-aminobenzoate synthetase component 1
MTSSDPLVPPEPLVREVPYRDPLAAFTVFVEEPNALFLDSALVVQPLGRYSFIAVDPFQVLSAKGRELRLDGRPVAGDPFAVLARELARYPLSSRPDLPPFQGGAAGYFGYELARHLEQVPLAPLDDMGFPDLALGFYDVVLAFDQRERKAWILSNGYPESGPQGRKARAEARAEAMAARLATAPVEAAPAPDSRGPVAVTSNFTRSDYQAAVARVIDYIYAGDIFQANLTQRFRTELPAGLTPFTLYRRLRQLNPAPFAAYLDFGEVVIASSSPERFLAVRDGRVETRPIKGTRPRGRDPAEDQALMRALLASEKDRAENVMIVDLLRSDLSRVCRDASVAVPELCICEAFATVFHLVSTIVGELEPGKSALDLLRASFPGGSITGAPKIRAMEIIAELEPTQRGPYCGTIGYMGFDGTMDSNIVIRTYALSGSTVTFQAGGGIVADSDPAEEYEESLAKARALIDALSCQAKLDDSGHR